MGAALPLYIKELFLKLKSDDPGTLPIFQTSGATSMS
jgi:hypothetical protein